MPAHAVGREACHRAGPVGKVPDDPLRVGLSFVFPFPVYSMLQRTLIVVHRYLGIPMSLVFIVWFISGIVMMYAGGMPSLSPQARVDRLPVLDFSAIQLSAAEAATRATPDASPSQARLLTVLGRPAYRFTIAGSTTTVFADTGERLESAGPETARRIVAAFATVPLDSVHYLGVVSSPDQWTLGLVRELPLHKLRINDRARTELYVSPRTAEVVLATNRSSRALAWAGTIPHWFYITPLRTNQPAWYWSVVIASAVGSLIAMLGLILAFTQFRRSRPFSLSRSIPYRGMMRWHYITGAVFGLFALTWAFSGLLSMQPFAWQSVPGLAVHGDVYSGGPLDLQRFPMHDAAIWSAVLGEHSVREIELTRIQDEPYYLVRHSGSRTVGINEQQFRASERAQPPALLLTADPLRVREEPFSIDSLLERLAAATAGGVPIAEHELLTRYDAYYYSRTGQAPLPVLRVKFEDPQRTWYYVDPALSRIVSRLHRMNRLERWLFNGLHSLDFAFWYNRRPLWDTGLIVLSIGALATSTIGLWLGAGRIRRFVRRRKPAATK